MVMQDVVKQTDAAVPIYGRILVPVDGSLLAEDVLPHVVSLARRYGSAVDLVRAYNPPPSLLVASAASSLPGTGPVLDPTPFIAAGKQEADVYLDRVAGRLAAVGIAVERRRLDGAAGESIVAEARERAADLIAMTTHGRGGLGRLVTGSVAGYVLQHAPCPVLLVRSSRAA
jgi:nucleotide-binding universal stress UspA family protein